MRSRAKGNEGSSASYGGNAPSVLVSALYMPEAPSLTSFQAEPIPGTPWYKCTDVVVLELVGKRLRTANRRYVDSLGIVSALAAEGSVVK